MKTGLISQNADIFNLVGPLVRTFFPGALNMKFHNLFYFKVFRENLISQLEVAVEILEL